MNKFVWVYGENGQPFILNTDHIESADKREHYVEVCMVSGQVVQVQGTIEKFAEVVFPAGASTETNA